MDHICTYRLEAGIPEKQLRTKFHSWYSPQGTASFTDVAKWKRHRSERALLRCSLSCSVSKLPLSLLDQQVTAFFTYTYSRVQIRVHLNFTLNKNLEEEGEYYEKCTSKRSDLRADKDSLVCEHDNDIAFDFTAVKNGHEIANPFK